MNEKGMIITSLLYAILVLFILILFTIVLTVGVRKNLVDGISDKVEDELDYIPPTISGLNVLPVFSGQNFTSANYAAGLTATDDVDGDVTEDITCVLNTTINCTVKDAAGNVSATFTRTTATGVTSLVYSYSGTYRLFTAANTGTYKIQLWGAQGGNNTLAVGGKGGYTEGQIYLTSGQNLYIYVGGSSTSLTGGYNGGGNGGANYNARGGGGATDARLVVGEWNDSSSLISRIMVAAGGGGANGYSTGSVGGYAGGLTGSAGTSAGGGTNYTNAQGGNRTSGGQGAVSPYPGVSGGFGYGGSSTTNRGGGGGGGYYGGGSGSWNSSIVGSGGGGSSFISGYSGCNAVNEQGIHNGTSLHYSELLFSSIVMTAGNASQPTYDGGSTQTGNAYSGYAKITFISN